MLQTNIPHNFMVQSIAYFFIFLYVFTTVHFQLSDASISSICRTIWTTGNISILDLMDPLALVTVVTWCGISSIGRTFFSSLDNIELQTLFTLIVISLNSLNILVRHIPDQDSCWFLDRYHLVWIYVSRYCWYYRNGNPNRKIEQQKATRSRVLPTFI